GSPGPGNGSPGFPGRPGSAKTVTPLSTISIPNPNRPVNRPKKNLVVLFIHFLLSPENPGIEAPSRGMAFNPDFSGISHRRPRPLHADRRRITDATQSFRLSRCNVFQFLSPV